MHRLTRFAYVVPELVWRSRRTILVFAAIWLVGLGALAFVVDTQSKVDGERKAQLANEAMQRELGRLTLTAFSPVLLERAGLPAGVPVGFQLEAGKQALRASLAEVARYDSAGEELGVVVALERFLPDLDRMASLVAAGRTTPAVAAFARSNQAGGTYGNLVAQLRALSVADGREADQARAEQLIGEIVAFSLMLLAFTLALYRATGLARQKHELLEQSRVEALTDTLTGLANRRKLFADMDALRRELPPPNRLALGMFDLNGFKQYNDTFGHPAGDALLVRLARRLIEAVAGDGAAYRMGGDEFCVIARGDDPERVVVAAARALCEHGETYEVTCSYGCSVIGPDGLTLEQALQLADERLYDNKRSTRSQANTEAHDVLLRLIAEQDRSLATHLSAVGRLADAVARKLGLTEDQVSLTRLTAELHDVGKTAIPDAILNKPGPLDDEEWSRMKEHTIIGERILAAAPALAAVAPPVRSSHEHLDGTGYPDGLLAEAIPISSRIVAVVDAYDAMTSDRAYSAPISSNEAIDELRRCAGSQFDPAVTDAFISVLQESIPDLSELRSPRRERVAA